MNEVFELTSHGGGGFTYSEVWNMDVPKRRFNLIKINQYLERVEEIRNQSKTITEKTDPKTMQVPDFAMANRPQDKPFVSKVKTKK
jgi:hypothetical protein